MALAKSNGWEVYWPAIVRFLWIVVDWSAYWTFLLMLNCLYSFLLLLLFLFWKKIDFMVLHVPREGFEQKSVPLILNYQIGCSQIEWLRSLLAGHCEISHLCQWICLPSFSHFSWMFFVCCFEVALMRRGEEGTGIRYCLFKRPFSNINMLTESTSPQICFDSPAVCFCWCLVAYIFLLLLFFPLNLGNMCYLPGKPL